MLFRKKAAPAPDRLPRHVAVIMDGNGRWAKRRGLPRTAGHRAGAKTFETISRRANALGIDTMTFYAFSTENWKRPAEEVSALMDLFADYLRRIEQFQKENMRIRFLGDPAPLSDELRGLMRQAQEQSAGFTGTCVNLAINYGGRDEIVHAARQLARQTQAGTLAPDAITEATLEQALYTGDCPPVDLLIRPGGEARISNFLLWQSAYAELYFCNTLWPDFGPDDLDRALAWFAARNRRFGGV